MELNRDEKPPQPNTRAAFSFLITDVEVGLTLCHIAREAGSDTEKRERNQANARRAYDAVVRFSEQATLTDAEEQQLSKKLHQLKSTLQNMGESL